MTDVKYEDWRPALSPEEEAQVAEGVVALKARVSLLRTLRERIGLTQAELAEILETSQSNVSKIEAKDDPYVSTLRKVIEAKGGKLKVIATFPEGDIEIPLFLSV